MTPITFNRPFVTGREFIYIQQAIDNLHLSGNGPFAEHCTGWLEQQIGSRRAMLTPSCTAALEMAMLLVGLQPGDEVIMPSFTFVSTANAVALRGGTPVFVDIRPDTLNLDEQRIEPALTDRTRAILPVHYAGVGCDMNAISSIAAQRDVVVVEDAAHALMASFEGRPLGGIGEIGCLSFHETKNLTCGEGGAILVNDPALIESAEVIQEKGTDRRRFFAGDVDHYTWIELGSSFLLSEINAAYLWAQLEHASEITADRIRIWRAYHQAFEALEDRERLRRPVTPPECDGNGHLYYLLLPDRERRDGLIAALKEQGIMAVFHYVPLHSAPAGRRFGRASGSLEVTSQVSDRLVRLPLWAGMTDQQVDRVISAVSSALS